MAPLPAAQPGDSDFPRRNSLSLVITGGQEELGDVCSSGDRRVLGTVVAVVEAFLTGVVVLWLLHAEWWSRGWVLALQFAIFTAH